MVKPRSNDKLPLTHERLQEAVHYDPLTGVFTAKVQRSTRTVGREIGSIDPKGYRRMRIDGVRYLAHRLAWFYMTGAWPKVVVDHIDGQPANNTWANLREADYSQSGYNRSHPNKSSGLRGAVWVKDRGHWQSIISHNGKAKRLGYFKTAQEAHEAFTREEHRIRGAYAFSHTKARPQ